MTQQIKIKRSSATATPSTTFGELAVTHIGGQTKLYVGDSTDTPVEVGGSSFAKLNSPSFTGTPLAPTATQGNNSTQIATTAYVDTGLATKASSTLTSSHIFVGNASNVATDVAMSGDATLSNAGALTIANNAITGAKIASAAVTGAKIASATITGSNIASTTITGSNIANATITGTQIASSVALAGSPTTTTQVAGDSSTKIATTAYSDALNDGNIKVGNASNIGVAVTLSGDATLSNTGALTIANNAVTNAKLATAGANTWKGNNTGSTANVADNAAGNLTESTSSVLTITGGTNALLNSATIQVKQASTSQSGYLSSTDWNTFNNKMNTVTTPTANDILLTNGSGQAIDSGYQIETSLSAASTKIPNSAAVQDAIQSSQQGLSVKQSVLAATTAALPAVTAAGSGATKTLTANANGVLSIDGVSTWIDVTNDGGSTNPDAASGSIASRVLVKDQATGADNGIYHVTTKGSVSTPFVLTRAVDANSASEFTNGMFTFVQSGTTNSSTGFVCTNSGSVTLETTAINFSQFSGAGAITAGTGLVKSGNTISIATQGVTGSLIANTTITAGNIANATITGTQIASSIALAGSPTTTTQAVGDNSTKIATTAYVDNLPSANIKVGNAGGVGTAVALSGDATLSNAGVLTIANGAVTGAKIASATITGSNIASTTITGGNLVNSTITATQIATSVAGNGLQGGGGSALSVKADSTTGATVAQVAVSSNGVGVTVDNSSIVHTAGTIAVSLIDGGTF